MPIKRGRPLRCLVRSLLRILFVVGLLGLLLAIAVYHEEFSPPEIQIDGDRTANRLVGIRGERTTFVIVGHAVNGHWASSTGLDWIGEDHMSRLIPPKEKDWGDTMPQSGSSKNRFEIPASVIVPSSPGTDLPTFSGAIIGDFERPILSGRGFENKDEHLNTPVVIEIVSAQAAKQLAKQKRKPALHFFLLCLSVTVGSIVLLACFHNWLGQGCGP